MLGTGTFSYVSGAIGVITRSRKGMHIVDICRKGKNNCIRSGPVSTLLIFLNTVIAFFYYVIVKMCYEMV